MAKQALGERAVKTLYNSLVSVNFSASTSNICLDCNEEMAVYAETSELVCQSCGKTKKLFGTAFDEAQLFSQEGYNGKPTPTSGSDAHLEDVNTVILDGREVRAPARCHLLANCINQCRRVDGKLINYVCFLYDFFQAVSSEDWPQKEKSLSVFPPTFQKLQNPTVAGKKGLKSGGRKSHSGEAFVVFCF